MPEQYSNLLIVTGVLCLLILFWVLSIVLVYWDASRRQVRGAELAAWVALVALLPLIGLFAYMFYRLLGLFISPPTHAGRRKRSRETMLQPETADRRRSSTVPAVDYSRNARAAAGTPLTEPYLEASGREAPVQTRTAIRLRVIEGQDKDKEFVIHRLPAVIGRGPEVLISLDADRGVSRRHAEIYDHAGVVRIRDLQSTHGTQVNGFGIGDKALDTGDRIQTGNTAMLITIEGLEYGG